MNISEIDFDKLPIDKHSRMVDLIYDYAIAELYPDLDYSEILLILDIMQQLHKCAVVTTSGCRDERGVAKQK